MKEKIGITELFQARLGDNFEVGQRLLDIRRQAESIARFADKAVQEDGEFAKVYAESIADWLESIAVVAELAVAKVVEVKGKEKEYRKENLINQKEGGSLGLLVALRLQSQESQESQERQEQNGVEY